VLGRNRDGGLVQLYTTEYKVIWDSRPANGGPGGPAPIGGYDETTLGEIVFVRGLSAGIGVDVHNGTLFNTALTTNYLGSTYNVYDETGSGSAYWTPEVTRKINPAWQVKENQRLAAAEADTVRRIIAYQNQQASNGLPSFQFELGKRYANGDGVKTNLLLARHWLQSACTNGSAQASNLLKQIGPRQ
jgi:hypothetical protein